MKLIETVHVEGFLVEDWGEFGFKRTCTRYDGSKYDTVEPQIIEKIYSKMSDYAKSLDNTKTEDIDYWDDTVVAKYYLENVGVQLYFTKEKTTLEQAVEYQILETLGCLEGAENWFGHSEYTIEGYCVEEFKVGGHDILEILSNHENQYCHIILNIYEEA